MALGMITPAVAVIFVIVVLIIFGPGKLPSVGKGIGKGISEFKREVKSETKEETNSTEKTTT